MADTSPEKDALEERAWEAWAIVSGVAYRDRQHGLCFYDGGTKQMSWRTWQGARATPPSPSTAPEAWVYECRQPHTDPVIWAEFFSRDKPSDAPHIRNARPLYGDALASRPAEVDDEGLPDLPEPVAAFAPNGRAVKWHSDYAASPWIGDGYAPLFTAEQYRQGQRDAVAADRARREVDGKIPRESNDALIKLAKYWKLDGDWMTCRGCRRSLIASRDGEELNHGDGCKFWDQHHPWAQLRELIARRPPAENTP